MVWSEIQGLRNPNEWMNINNAKNRLCQQNCFFFFVLIYFKANWMNTRKRQEQQQNRSSSRWVVVLPKIPGTFLGQTCEVSSEWSSCSCSWWWAPLEKNGKEMYWFDYDFLFLSDCQSGHKGLTLLLLCTMLLWKSRTKSNYFSCLHNFPRIINQQPFLFN